MTTNTQTSEQRELDAQAFSDAELDLDRVFSAAPVSLYIALSRAIAGGDRARRRRVTARIRTWLAGRAGRAARAAAAS